MSRFLNKRYKELNEYIPGEQPRDMEYIKLNTNESPFPPAPSVIEAINSSAKMNLQLYPDPECVELREKIAEVYKIQKENIFVANGSDDILNFSFMAFCGGDKPVHFPEISYGFYKVFADLHGINYTFVPMRDDLSINYKNFCKKNGVVVIANPNAPTGLYLSISEVEEIVRSNPQNIVLIDEAYIDFGGESCYPLTCKYDNLLVVATFSKSRSMAGARLGFAIASKEIINDLNKIKYSTNPYNVNSMTLAAGVATLNENDYYINNSKETIATRDYVTEELIKQGFKVIPSKANFIFVKSNTKSGEFIYTELKKRGVLVRHFNQTKIKDYNRVTIGTKNQMIKFIEIISELGENNENV